MQGALRVSDAAPVHLSGREPHRFTWSTRRAYWVAAAALALCLAPIMTTLSDGNIAVPDDGIYAKQAVILADGTWSGTRPVSEIDESGLNSALGPEITYDDRQIPYPRNPLFSTLLSLSYRLANYRGLVAFSVVGVWVASVAAGLLARMLDVRFGIPALLATGLVSPLVFDTSLVSAHGMAAGMCGLTLLALGQVVDRRRRLPLLVATVGAALLVGLRTEGVIAMVATSIVLAMMAVQIRPFRVDRLAATAAASVVVATVSSYLASGYWTQKIIENAGRTSSISRELSSDRSPLRAAWVSLIRPWYGTAVNAQPALVFAVIATLVAAVSVKVAPRRWLLPVMLLVVAAGCVITQAWAGSGLITGLFSAFPALGAGLILLRREDLGRPMITRHLGISALTLAGITYAAYSVGGSAEWGGRFYHLLLPLLVPLVIVGLHHGYRSLPQRPARVAAVAIVVGLWGSPRSL